MKKNDNKTFEVLDKKLYDIQDDIFRYNKILVGIELNSSYIFVDGSSYLYNLYDELIYFSGLDEENIKTIFFIGTIYSI